MSPMADAGGQVLKIICILLLALAVRLWLLTGFYGSDDFVYADAVSKILNGDWRPFAYIGSVRYGFNLPLAFTIRVFGASEYGYTLYPLFTSLVNILLVWSLGSRLFENSNAGLAAAFLMAVCPLDVIWSGRIQPDAPLMMWMTASVLCFVEAGAAKESSLRSWLGFLAGLCLGIAYTTKNAALFLSPLFAYSWATRRAMLRDLVFLSAGFLVIFAAESSLFWAQTGNPLFAFTLQAQFNHRAADAGTEFITSVFAYPYWAFLALQHSGLTFYLLVGSFISFLAKDITEPIQIRENLKLVAAWLVCLLGFLTFYVMSWNPFKLIWKQSNYMLMFMPPVVLLTAYFIQTWGSYARSLVLVAVAFSSILFAHMEREVLAAESYNARATAEFFAKISGKESLYCGARDCGVVTMFMRFRNRDRLVPYDNPYGNARTIANLSEVRTGYVAINTRWLRRSWNSVSPANQILLTDPPSTWRLQAEFRHSARGIMSFGTALVSYMEIHGGMPRKWTASLQAKIRDAVFPGPVRIYRIDGALQS
jgi:Dolichyl-phosphate-mannose-protein mannosyltransferase